ncbi:MAG: ATP-binding protein [Firmicutes bacterium]|nr:ATP-binding protein [Bacillota bacterium]
MKELTVEARLENLEKVIGFISQNLEEAGGSPAIEIQVHLAVEEIFVNVASYAYEPETGPVTVQCGLSGTDRFVIVFIDQGVPYDPLAKEDPDVTLEIEERQIGGLGIFLAKQYMEEMSYRYENGSNILTMIKYLA